MNVQSYFKTIVYLIVSSVLLASCAADSLADFSPNGTDGTSQNEEFSICPDTTNYHRDRPLIASDFAGAFVKTRELSCGVAGCAEAPFMTVIFSGITPSLELSTDGTIVNPGGPFDRFESWKFRPAQDTDVPNRFEMIDDASPNDSFQVSIFSTGPCRLRIENGQGWVEFTRLQEV